MKRIWIVLVWLASALAGCSTIHPQPDIHGTWIANVAVQGNTDRATFVFSQQGQTLTGIYSGKLGKVSLEDGSSDGHNVSFTVLVPQGKVLYRGFTKQGSELDGQAVYSWLPYPNYGVWRAIKP